MVFGLSTRKRLKEELRIANQALTNNAAAALESARLQSERQQLESEHLLRQQRRIQDASPATIAELRDLIREKYRLDVEIWGLRDARRCDRFIVEGLMERADGVWGEIEGIVGLWGDDGGNGGNEGRRWNEGEWERIREIRRRLRAGGVRVWKDNPPWG